MKWKKNGNIEIKIKIGHDFDISVLNSCTFFARKRQKALRYVPIYSFSFSFDVAFELSDLFLMSGCSESDFSDGNLFFDWMKETLSKCFSFIVLSKNFLVWFFVSVIEILLKLKDIFRAMFSIVQFPIKGHKIKF